MEVSGKLVSRTGRTVTIELDDDVNFDLFTKSVGVNLRDERTITAQQRKFAYAVMADIAKSDIGGYWAGDNKAVENYFKAKYCLDNDLDYISLSTRLGNRTDANEFISMLLDFSLAHNVALSRMPINELEGDFGRRFEYSCLINKKCVICGLKPDLHHLTGSKVGMGNNRNHINNMGRMVIALCRTHHDIFHHNEKEMMSKYHLTGIPVDEKIAKLYHLNTKEK